ncbi:MAG: hypothetical protein AAFR96_08505 [Planctomycetota bacterium]
MIRLTTTAAALLTVAGSASAQFAPGSLLYISNSRTAGGTDTINALDYSSLNSSLLYTFAPDTQNNNSRGGLDRGPNGEFYVGSTNRPPVDPSTTSIARIDDLFGTPTETQFAMNPELQSVNGIEYDAFTDSVLVLNNPGSNGVIPRQFEGLQSYDRASGAFQGVPVPDNGQPISGLGGGFVPTNRAPGQYYFGSQTGGLGFDGSLPTNGSQSSAVIARVTFDDPGNPLSNTTETVIDLAPANTGAEFLGLLAGMTVLPNGNIVFLENNSFNIWEVVLDANGDFQSLEVLFDGSDVARSERSLGRTIIYNEFTNKLNYTEFVQDGTTLQDIVEINLDGTGRRVLASSLSDVGSLVAIPAPASAALLGLGGLAAIRRRR